MALTLTTDKYYPPINGTYTLTLITTTPAYGIAIQEYQAGSWVVIIGSNLNWTTGSVVYSILKSQQGDYLYKGIRGDGEQVVEETPVLEIKVGYPPPSTSDYTLTLNASPDFTIIGDINQIITISVQLKPNFIYSPENDPNIVNRSIILRLYEPVDDQWFVSPSPGTEIKNFRGFTNTSGITTFNISSSDAKGRALIRAELEENPEIKTGYYEIGWYRYQLSIWLDRPAISENSHVSASIPNPPFDWLPLARLDIDGTPQKFLFGGVITEIYQGSIYKLGTYYGYANLTNAKTIQIFTKPEPYYYARSSSNIVALTSSGIATTLNLNLVSQSGYGTNTSFTFNAILFSFASPLIGKTIGFYVKSTGGFYSYLIGTKVTNTSGIASLNTNYATIAQRLGDYSGQFYIQARFAGDSFYQSSSSPWVGITVYGTSSSLNLQVPNKSFTNIPFYGTAKLMPAAGGKIIYGYLDNVQVSSGTTNSGGTALLRFNISSEGAHYLKAVWQGEPMGLAPAVSNIGTTITTTIKQLNLSATGTTIVVGGSTQFIITTPNGSFLGPVKLLGNGTVWNQWNNPTGTSLTYTWTNAPLGAWTFIVDEYYQDQLVNWSNTLDVYVGQQGTLVLWGSNISIGPATVYYKLVIS